MFQNQPQDVMVKASARDLDYFEPMHTGAHDNLNLLLEEISPICILERRQPFASKTPCSISEAMI